MTILACELDSSYERKICKLYEDVSSSISSRSSSLKDVHPSEYAGHNGQLPGDGRPKTSIRERNNLWRDTVRWRGWSRQQQNSL